MSINIGVFLGSHEGDTKRYKVIINQFADWVGKKKHNLIFGGAESGLMLHLAKKLKIHNVKVTSLLTENITTCSDNFRFFSELIITKNSLDRKSQFFSRSDVFVVFPGGIGTLNELIDILTRKLLNETKKNIYLINDLSYWDPLINLFEYFEEKGFIKKKLIRKNLKICDLNYFLENFQLECQKLK